MFAAYLGVTLDHPRTPSEGAIELTPRDATQPTSTCADRSCTLAPADIAAAAIGANVFGGYAFSSHVDAGVRILAGPNLGGGGVFAFGPAVSLRATSALRIGAWAIFGDASARGRGTVLPPAGYDLRTSELVPIEGSTAGGIGAGVELSARLAELARGELVVNTTPFFLLGSGNGFCVPLGFAYRFQ